jgi:hypothetical protein
MTLLGYIPDAPERSWRTYTGFIALAVTCTLAFMWVMFWNRYPLVFGDTGTYLMTAITGKFRTYRPSGYPLVVWLAVLTRALWPVVLFQAVIMAYLFVRIVRLDFGLPRVAVALSAVLVSLTTTLSWWVVTVMSDIWCGAVAMSVYLLLFHWGRICRLERLWLGVILLFALTFHISYPLIMIITLAIMLVLHMFKYLAIQAPVAGIRLIAAILILGGLFFPLSNLIRNKTITPSSGAGLLLLARVATDGHVVEMLKDRCPDEDFTLCAHIPALEAMLKERPPSKKRNEWPCPCSEEGYVNWILVFGEGSPIRQVYVHQGSKDMGRVLWASLKHDPVGHMVSIVEGTWDLLANSALTPFIDGRPGLGARLSKLSSSEHQKFRGSRSYGGTLRVGWFNIVIRPLVNIGMVLCVLAIVLLLVKRSGPAPDSNYSRPFLRNATYFFVFCLINAAVMYTMVGDHTRYQSRCSWMIAMQPLLLVFVAAVHGLRAMFTRRKIS